LSRIYCILLMLVSLGGCTYLPADGPRHDDITGAATVSVKNERRKVVYDYVLIDVSDKVIECLSDLGPGSFFRTFGTGRGGPAPTINVGVGDVVAITIFESASGGLFIPPEAGVRPGNFVTLPAQTVGRTGTISIPYAGEVRAAGRTPDQIRVEIERLLGSRAVEPQVIVTLVEQTAMAVTLVGETASSRLQIRPNERILDLIARGGVKGHPGYELFVTLQRRGLRATVYLPMLVNDPRENIYVAPGDTLYVYREQQKFVALGALGAGGVTSGLTGLFAFEQERLSLNEGLAKAGGLIDARANPHVLLYRMENRETLEKIGADISQFGAQAYIPTIYRTNLKDPSAFFVAQRFPMRHKDVIYAASANSVELEKFMAHSQAVTSFVSNTALDALITRDAIRALGN
jgi:polysaccharide biosynthesis/export protein